MGKSGNGRKKQTKKKGGAPNRDAILIPCPGGRKLKRTLEGGRTLEKGKYWTVLISKKNRVHGPWGLRFNRTVGQGKKKQ